MLNQDLRHTPNSLTYFLFFFPFIIYKHEFGNLLNTFRSGRTCHTDMKLSNKNNRRPALIKVWRKFSTSQAANELSQKDPEAWEIKHLLENRNCSILPICPHSPAESSGRKDMSVMVCGIWSTRDHRPLLHRDMLTTSNTFWTNKAQSVR